MIYEKKMFSKRQSRISYISSSSSVSFNFINGIKPIKIKIKNVKEKDHDATTTTDKD